MAVKDIQCILKERTTSSFGVSIGTGLMLESIADPIAPRYDPDREIPKRIDLKKYDGWIINVYTLLRNIFSSINDRSIMLSKEVVHPVLDVLVEELLVIQSVLEPLVGLNYVKIFLPEYDELIERFNVNKDIELNYIQNNIEAIKLFKKHLIGTLRSIVPLLVIDPMGGYKIDHIYRKHYLLTTHMCLDLLQYDGFTLLDSHTGLIKENSQWYEKLHPVGTQDISMLPVIDLVLYILGDNQLVRGLDTKTKKELLLVAIENKWNYRTSRLKAKWDINKSKLLRDAISKFKGY